MHLAGPERGSTPVPGSDVWCVTPLAVTNPFRYTIEAANHCQISGIERAGDAAKCRDSCGPRQPGRAAMRQHDRRSRVEDARHTMLPRLPHARAAPAYLVLSNSEAMLFHSVSNGVAQAG